MYLLRFVTIAISIVAHTALAVAFVADYKGRERDMSFYEGGGDDQLMVEATISIQALTSLGQDIETVQANNVVPQEAREAIAPIEELKPFEQLDPMEELRDAEVITAKAERVETTEVLREVEVIEPVKPRQIVQEAQAEQIVLKEMQAASGKQSGGDVTKRNRHFGKISTRIRKHVINPGTRRIGTTVVRFSVDQGGKLLSREVLKSSGSSRLDRAALDSIDRAAPFPPFPEGAITQAAVLKMKFNFSTR